MKLKTFLASASACAIAVSAMAITASAEITNANADANYMYDVVANLPAGVELTDIYGVEASFDKAPSGEQTNVGAICWQSTSVSWSQKEFSQGDDKDIKLNADGKSVTLLNTAPLFKAGDEYAQVFVSQWVWDGDMQIDFSVVDVKLLGADGKVLGGAATTDAPANTDTPAATTTASGSNTGDAGIALAVAGLAVAGAAAYVARKKD